MPPNKTDDISSEDTNLMNPPKTNTANVPDKASAQPDDWHQSQLNTGKQDDIECGTAVTKKRLLVLVEGDLLATKLLMERFLTRVFPFSDDPILIELPNHNCVFVEVKILGDSHPWETNQNDLDAEADSTNRIVVAPLRTALDTELVFDRFLNTNFSLKTVSAQNRSKTNSGLLSNEVSVDEELLNVISEFAEQEGLLEQVGGY